MSTANTPAAPAQPPQLFKGIVKQALSGDSIIIRGQPKGGPPPERQLNFSNITAPRLARRPGGPGGKADEGKDEPWAWESREFVRKKLVGKEVTFVVDYKVPASGREYGTVYLGKDTETGENVTEDIVREGLAAVRKEGKSDVTKLIELEEQAKSAGRGRWGAIPEVSINPFNHSNAINKHLLGFNCFHYLSFIHIQDIICTASLQAANDKEFVGTVTECVNADALVVRLADGSLKKIFLASIRPPRPSEQGEKGEKEEKVKPKEKPVRPLYEIPFMYEARAYLRKKLIGRKVQVSVDYIQPASQTFPEKICSTVKHEGVNIAEALVSKGYATVARYRQDDDQRASDCRGKGSKGSQGFAWKGHSGAHVVDLSGDAAKSKLFLPYLQRAGKISAVVEYVASGSRLRLYVPRETRLINFSLAGISCPRAGRASGPSGPPVEGEPFGKEALLFTKDLCYQREVEIEVTSIHISGSYFGFLFIDNKNLSVTLVEEGLATVHFSAERTQYNRPLQTAEGNAKGRRAKVWQNYEDTKDEIKPEDDKTERKVDQKPVVVTEITPELHVFVQFTDDGDKLEALMNDLRRELNEKPPMTGAYTPKKGDLCAARYSGDGQWYRARVEKTLPDGEVAVVFIDYGNRENVKGRKCATLPAMPAFPRPPFAKEYALACVNLPTDKFVRADALYAVRHDTADGVFLLNIEYKTGGLDYITLADKTTKEDIAQNLVKEGFLLVDNRKERRLQKLVKDYQAAEKEAKTQQLNIWQYFNITEDDTLDGC
ncbi:nuclease domain-containing protein 1, partial [Orchesella cincta]